MNIWLDGAVIIFLICLLVYISDALRSGLYRIAEALDDIARVTRLDDD